MKRAALAGALLLAAVRPAGASLLDSVPKARPSLPGIPAYMAPVSGSFLFYEDFEHGMKRWHVQGGGDGVAWRLLEAHTCGGAFTMHLGKPKQAPYAAARGESYLVLTDGLDLTTAKRPTLKYDVKGVCDPISAITYEVELKPPGGAWRVVSPAVDGRFDGMRSLYLDLTPYAKKRVGLRFHAHVKPTQKPTKGLYLDDIHVIEAAHP